MQLHSVCIFCTCVPSSCNAERSAISVIDMLSSTSIHLWVVNGNDVVNDVLEHCKWE
jgi:hypothetical protein